MNAGKVRFPSHPNGAQTFTVARPEVLEVLKHAECHQWICHADFAGTREQLLAAGIATEDMFEHFGKSGVRTADDEFGTNWTLQRRAGGRFELTIRTRPDDSAEDIGSKRFQALKYWRNVGAAVEVEVTEALQRMRRAG